MVALNGLLSGYGESESFLLSRVKSPDFTMKACWKREPLFLLGHYFIVALFCQLYSTSWVTEEVKHPVLYHFQSIWIVLLHIKCSQPWDRLKPPSPDDYLEFSVSETVLFLFRPNMTVWGVVMHVSDSSIWKNEAGKWWVRSQLEYLVRPCLKNLKVENRT